MSNEKTVPVKKVAKRAKKKAVKRTSSKVVAAKRTPEEKAYYKRVEKAQALQAKMDKRNDVITLKFEKFCKENGLTAVCFFADSKVKMTGRTTSKGIKTYERVGLIEVNK